MIRPTVCRSGYPRHCWPNKEAALRLLAPVLTPASNYPDVLIIEDRSRYLRPNHSSWGTKLRARRPRSAQARKVAQTASAYRGPPPGCPARLCQLN